MQRQCVANLDQITCGCLRPLRTASVNTEIAASANVNISSLPIRYHPLTVDTTITSPKQDLPVSQPHVRRVICLQQRLCADVTTTTFYDTFGSHCKLKHNCTLLKIDTEN